MTNYLKVLSISIYLIFSSTFVWAISKSESKYTGPVLMSQFSNQMGFNLHWAKKCNFVGEFDISEEVAKLSWEDFKSFNSGWGGMLNYRSSGCNKDANKKINDEKRFYLEELKKEVNKKLGISSSNQKSLSNSSKKVSQTNSKIDYAKNKCSEIGYNKGTEKFADCVMKLIED